ncbi:MAG: hypothetical protein PF574_04585 [Candidatus Delongbacteria bacterium]|nr:hypothetical protein [Candidatus Delongbacteria bacterium]
MESYSNPRDFAFKIIELVKTTNIEQVELIGSLAENNFDEYSDIDIELKDNKQSPVEIISIALNSISAKYDILFSDWAKSLLPEKYVLSGFLKQENIFRFIDLTCYKDANFSDTPRDQLPQDKIYHIFKLWICNAKQEIRKRDDRNYIDLLFAKLFIENDSISNKTKFEKVLEWLHTNSDNSYLLNECDRIMDKINGNIPITLEK